MREETRTIEDIRGDGGEQKVGEEEINLLLAEIAEINRGTAAVLSRRRTVEDTRYCRWSGQSTDGRKHRSDKDGEEPFPWEGASDQRIRLADSVVVERVAVLVESALRAQVRIVRGMETTDEAFAGKMRTLLKWALENQLGLSYRRELTKLANYQEADYPAAGVLGVFWRQEMGMQMAEWSPLKVAEKFSQVWGEQIPPDVQEQLSDILLNALRIEEGQDFLTNLFPDMSRTRAGEILRAWHAGQPARVPEPYLAVNLPEVVALRLYEDIFLPPDTTDIQRARAVFLPRWYSKASFMERARREGWNRDFITEVMGDGSEHRGALGKTGFQLAEDMTANETGAFSDLTTHKNEVEVITAYIRGVNRDGVPGIYTVDFSDAAKRAAGPRRLLDYAHGAYPFVFFQREILNSRLMDTRGVPELAATDQQALKALSDSFVDYTSIATVPPLFVPANQPETPIVIRPLGQIPRRRPGDFEPMKIGDHPRANQEMQRELLRRSNDYFGRTDEGVSPDAVTLKRQFMVGQWLAGVKVANMMVIQLCQQYLTDEQIARIVGGSGAPVARTREEIQGQFDLWLTFDARDLDSEYLLKLAEVLGKWIVPLDTEQVIQRNKLVHRLFAAFDPQLAEDTLRPLEEANRKEMEDEELNFAKIAAGVEPPMMEQGQNWPLRLQVLQELRAKNPQAFERLSEDSKAILAARVEHLQFMGQQIENKQIGRVGSKPALAEGREE